MEGEMRTRKADCYPRVKNNNTSELKSTEKNRCRRRPGKRREMEETDRIGLVNCVASRKRRIDAVKAPPAEAVAVPTTCRKKAKVTPDSRRSGCGVGRGGGRDFFDGLPDDLVAFILAKLGASANCPADFICVLITCKRLNELALHSMVLSKASAKTFAIRAKKWSESTHRFLKRCADAGNTDACYTLGMIRFYCLQNRGNGASLMAKAAINSHAQALYSLSIIQFNGSGGSKNDKDLRAGVALCARAAFLGHVDALRELGHCLQDGYGVRQNVTEGRRFLVQANARELAAVIASNPSALSSAAAKSWLAHNYHQLMNQNNRLATALPVCPLLSDFGCNVPPPEVHPANKFLVEWFEGKKLEDGLRLCSHKGCGRPETRPHEFRRCSVCATVNYCSRACQALDWKLSHKGGCAPVERWMVGGDEDEEAGADGNDEDEVEMEEEEEEEDDLEEEEEEEE